MIRIDKEISINAPVGKIHNFVIKPSNLLQVWPSLMVISNEQQLPNGGYRANWIYKMDGLYFRGKGEVIDTVSGVSSLFRPKDLLKVKLPGRLE